MMAFLGTLLLIEQAILYVAAAQAATAVALFAIVIVLGRALSFIKSEIK